jgi:nucleoside-diphosphate-sugar epimerase
MSGKNLPISSARLKKTAAQTQFDTIRVPDWDYHPQWSTEEGLKEMVKWYMDTKNLNS